MFKLGGYKKGGEEEATESKDEGESPAPLAGMASKKAAKGILAAIESMDPSALDAALKKHYEACHGGEDE